MIETLKQRFLRMHRPDVRLIYKTSNGTPTPDYYYSYCTCGARDTTRSLSDAWSWGDQHLVAAAGGRWSW